MAPLLVPLVGECIEVERRAFIILTLKLLDLLLILAVFLIALDGLLLRLVLLRLLLLRLLRRLLLLGLHRWTFASARLVGVVQLVALESGIREVSGLLGLVRDPAVAGVDKAPRLVATRGPRAHRVVLTAPYLAESSHVAIMGPVLNLQRGVRAVQPHARAFVVAPLGLLGKLHAHAGGFPAEALPPPSGVAPIAAVFGNSIALLLGLCIRARLLHVTGCPKVLAATGRERIVEGHAFVHGVLHHVPDQLRGVLDARAMASIDEAPRLTAEAVTLAGLIALPAMKVVDAVVPRLAVAPDFRWKGDVIIRVIADVHYGRSIDALEADALAAVASEVQVHLPLLDIHTDASE
eukprot:CAMPEP_0177376798 /NCGR_PEP_ID=MMETSP0368-20130122/45424_1 /TAXON_ID=447022 ORGANISM="Scrippsiella hangoei-like, Strain SHHI-4" /NCGR_SAMPLE_ID=MMETSP0368 /ASSEMBLY_ACC=CAM_ASM_000363 /LENGTH=349 /DNA_ID=CAMNT_0018840567 /DNA_START=52 /DNA_END=1101 /DNA_ORIENTATION=+